MKSDIWIFLYLDNFVGLNVSKSLKRNLRKKKIFQISNLSDHYQLQYAFLQITEISKVSLYESISYFWKIFLNRIMGSSELKYLQVVWQGVGWLNTHTAVLINYLQYHCLLLLRAKHTTCGGLYVTWKFQFSRPLFTVRCLFMAPIHAPKWQRLTAFPFRFFNPFLLFLNLKFAFKRKPYYGRETLKCYSLFSHCLIGT